jgi:hypothetical protein
MPLVHSETIYPLSLSADDPRQIFEVPLPSELTEPVITARMGGRASVQSDGHVPIHRGPGFHRHARFRQRPSGIRRMTNKY